MKPNNDIKALDIYDHNLLYTANTNDSTTKKSVTETLSILDEFFCFFGPKPNKENLEVAGISVKKGLNVALSGMKNIDLEKETQWKFLKFIILTTKNLKKERISKIIYKTDCFENVENKKSNPWRENHNIQGIGISKIIYLALVTLLLNSENFILNYTTFISLTWITSLHIKKKQGK